MQWDRAILVVDDEADCRETIAGMLSANGFSVIAADGGGEALRLIEQGLEFDLLLVDLAMPGMDGVELAQAVRARRAALPVVFFTGGDTEQVSDERWVLRKPFLTRTLVETLRAALGLTQDTDAGRCARPPRRSEPGLVRGGQAVGKYVAARLIQLVFVLFGVSVVVFLTMHLLPGDVAQLLLGDHATNEQLQRLREQLGLDQPVWVQYLRFMRGALTGDLGTSIQSNRPALDDVVAAFPVTLQLALVSLMLASLCGVPIGVLSAVWQGSRFDAVVMTLTLFGVSMPIFWLGLMLLVLFAAGLGWLPVGGLMPVGLDPPRVTGMSVIDSLLSGNATMIGASLRHMLLPAVTLASVPLALIARITRAEVLAAATLDHVRTARAKGVTDAQVILWHILRNAAIPIVTVIGLQLGLLLSGAVLTETIYSLPGLGRLMVDSILSRDYTVVQAGALFIAVLFVLVNLVVDILYAALDPRISRA